MKPVKIRFKSESRPYVRIAQVSHHVEDYWVGIGFYKKRKKARRFLRIRDGNGACIYYFWTEPEKGRSLPVVFGFRKRVQITREQATKHYKK